MIAGKALVRPTGHAPIPKSWQPRTESGPRGIGECSPWSGPFPPATPRLSPRSPLSPVLWTGPTSPPRSRPDFQPSRSRTGLFMQTLRRSPGFPSESFPTCMGSLTTPVPDTARDLSPCLVLPSPSDYKVGVRYGIFEARCPSPLVPLSTLQYEPHDSHCKTRGQIGSLLLICRALSSPTF
jgi:hypothetical protein